MENIINYDCDQVTQSFIHHFYNSWVIDPQSLLYTVISQRSKLKYNTVTYEYTDIIAILNQLKSQGLEISSIKHEVIDSKSRQIYILVKGIIKNSQSTNNLTQTFVLINNGKSYNQWSLINSILIID